MQGVFFYNRSDLEMFVSLTIIRKVYKPLRGEIFYPRTEEKHTIPICQGTRIVREKRLHALWCE